MSNYFPIVVQVVPLDDYKVNVYFDDGKIAKYDMQDQLTGVFAELKDIGLFKRSCTVMNDTLSFDLSGEMDEANGLDIDVFTLYELEAVNNDIDDSIA